MYTHNQMLMNFLNAMYPEGFSEAAEEYAVVFFNNNQGRGAKKITMNENMVSEILDHCSALDANEVILISSQPTGDLNSYPSQTDIEVFNTVEQGLTQNNIAIYNSAIISKLSGEWQCTSFKDCGQPGNFK